MMITLPKTCGHFGEFVKCLNHELGAEIAPHFGQRTGFRARVNEIKSGIPRSGLYRCKMFARWVYKNTNARDDTTMRCFFFLTLMRLYLCKMFARWVYQNTNAHAMKSMTRRCLWFFGWMRLYLCKIFARWVYKNTNARNDTTMPGRRRCIAFGFSDGCVCIFVK